MHGDLTPACMETTFSPTRGSYLGLDIDGCMKFAGWIGKGNGCCFFFLLLVLESKLLYQAKPISQASEI